MIGLDQLRHKSSPIMEYLGNLSNINCYLDEEYENLISEDAIKPKDPPNIVNSQIKNNLLPNTQNITTSLWSKMFEILYSCVSQNLYSHHIITQVHIWIMNENEYKDRGNQNIAIYIYIYNSYIDLRYKRAYALLLVIFLKIGILYFLCILVSLDFLYLIAYIPLITLIIVSNIYIYI